MTLGWRHFIIRPQLFPKLSETIDNLSTYHIYLLQALENLNNKSSPYMKLKSPAWKHKRGNSPVTFDPILPPLVFLRSWWSQLSFETTHDKIGEIFWKWKYFAMVTHKNFCRIFFLTIEVSLLEYKFSVDVQ